MVAVAEIGGPVLVLIGRVFGEMSTAALTQQPDRPRSSSGT